MNARRAVAGERADLIVPEAKRAQQRDPLQPQRQPPDHRQRVVDVVAHLDLVKRRHEFLDLDLVQHRRLKRLRLPNRPLKLPRLSLGRAIQPTPPIAIPSRLMLQERRHANAHASSTTCDVDVPTARATLRINVA